MSVDIPPRTSDTMDLMEHGYLDAASPCDYTFNFWTDYLGLSTLVAKNKMHTAPFSPNSITESLKATLGLEDDVPVCPCVIAQGRDTEGHVDCCCCCAAPGSPHISIYDLQERISLLGPYEHLSADRDRDRDRDRDGDRDGDSPPHRGNLPGLDLLSMERRRKQSARGKPEPRVCVFCRNNGAPEEVYGTHILKTADGRVLCPILRAYTCPLCSANGDNAHTIKYCPLSREQPGGQRLLRGARATGKRLKIY